MNKRQTKAPIGFRPSEKLEQDILDVAELHSIADKRLGKPSPYMRLATSEDVRLWTSSPYIALAARHFLYVGPNGDFIYSRVERLRLNTGLNELPASLDMKHPKLQAYIAQCPKEVGIADFLRSRWKCAKFVLRANGEVLDRRDDETGITSKSVLLSCGRPVGHEVSREVFTVLEDYVQWSHGDGDQERTDSVEINVDVPTLDLEICVVIDERLYRETADSRRPIFDRRALHFELQTAEGQRFAKDVPDELIVKFSNVVPQERKPGRDYLERLQEVQAAWKKACGGFADVGYPAPPFPKRAYFYRLRVARQNPGLRNAITWPRPERPRNPVDEAT